MISNTQIRSKLNNYAAFATAFLFTHNINAEIVYTDIEPDVTLDNDDYFYEIDIDNEGVNDFQFEIGNIANGIYILSADINGKKHQVKVEILK